MSAPPPSVRELARRGLHPQGRDKHTLPATSSVIGTRFDPSVLSIRWHPVTWRARARSRSASAPYPKVPEPGTMTVAAALYAVLRTSLRSNMTCMNGADMWFSARSVYTTLNSFMEGLADIALHVSSAKGRLCTRNVGSKLRWTVDPGRYCSCWPRHRTPRNARHEASQCVPGIDDVAGCHLPRPTFNPPL